MREELEEKDRLITQMNDIHLKGIGEMDSLREQLNRALATKSPPPPELKPIIERWQKQSKQTRDWTKANQLLEELNNLI